MNSFFFKSITVLVLILGTFGNIFFNLFFSLDKGTMEYSHGRFFFITFIYYLISVYYVGACAIRHKRYLGKIRLRLLLAIIVVTVLAIIYQLAFPEESMTGLTIALSVAMAVVIFCFVDVTVDELTGLNNRKGFVRACDELMHSQDMEGYSMIKIQVYHMQELNERTGMENGDRVLLMLARDVKYCTDVAEHKSICGRIG
ncbi:MAG: GGDEF domain-containing protein, partial [Treponema sp.]|nr:GGDEF domain-containing protein [Treponema sp.]